MSDKDYMMARVSAMEARIKELEAANTIEVHIVGGDINAHAPKGSPVTRIVLRLDNQSITLEPKCYE